MGSLPALMKEDWHSIWNGVPMVFLAWNFATLFPGSHPKNKGLNGFIRAEKCGE